MNEQSAPAAPQPPVSYVQLNHLKLPFRPLLFILSIVKILLAIIPVSVLYIYHVFIYQAIFIDIVRRYITCVTNLIWLRILLILLGFWQFDNSSYKFFERSTLMKFTLRSGYIGIANHSNIVDWMFYTYLLSPLFVRVLIVIAEDGKQQYMFIPLSFMEAYECAKTARGFEPIIIKEREINKIKFRKLKMSLLVVESFDNLKGPILVMLPGIHPGRYLPIEDKIIEVLTANEQKFSRWCIGLCATLPEQPPNIYHHQWDFIKSLLMSSWQHRLKITANQFHRNNYYQKRPAIAMNQFYESCDLKRLEVSYIRYVEQFQWEKELQQVEYQNLNDKKVKFEDNSQEKEQ